MRQGAAEQAVGRLGPVQLAELAKTLGLLRIIKEGTFAQLQFARFAVQQMNGGEGKLLLTDIQVRQLDLTIDHPGRLMPGR